MAKGDLSSGERGAPQDGREQQQRSRVQPAAHRVTIADGDVAGAAVRFCAAAYNGRTVKDTFYITSAIYYVNDVPHVGHTYEILACDVIARYHRARGEKVFFLTGSDEHSQNVARAAQERGLTPQQWTARIVPIWQVVWRRLQVRHDCWIRTSEERHVALV